MDGQSRAESISLDLMQRLPDQRKTQRLKLALLVATMLNTRSANIMDIAACLPIKADRTDMRYQWIIRLLSNPLVISKDIMEPFARDVFGQASRDGLPLCIIMDQSKVSDRHQVLMIALRWGERALPIEALAKLRNGVIFWSPASALVTRASPTDGMHAISDQR